MSHFGAFKKALSPQNIVGSIPFVGANYWAGENYQQQQQNLDWQQEAQRTTWAREDNAVKRRVADLKSVGLSPVLAAGSAAQSGPIVSTQAPQRQVAGTNMMDVASGVMAMLTQKSQIDRTESERNLMQSQQNLMRVQASKISAEALESLSRTERIPSEIKRNMAQSVLSHAAASDHLMSAQQRRHELSVARHRGISQHPSAFGGMIRDFSDMIENAGNAVGNTIDANRARGRVRQYRGTGNTNEW